MILPALLAALLLLVLLDFPVSQSALCAEEAEKTDGSASDSAAIPPGLIPVRVGDGSDSGENGDVDYRGER